MPHHLLSGGRNHSTDRCVSRCASGCNPHLKRHCTERCKSQCEHEHSIKELLRKVVRRGIEHGCDALQWLRAHAVAETNPYLRALLEEGVGISIPTEGIEGEEVSFAYRRRLGIPKKSWDLVDFNSISLTFLDVLLSLPAIDWSKFYGDKALFGDWGGVGMGAELRFKNSAWARLGFFGGGFGIYLDNFAWLGFEIGPMRVSLFKAELLFKADAAYRIDLPVGALATQAAPFYTLLNTAGSFENVTKTAAVNMVASLCELETPAKTLLTRLPVDKIRELADAVQTRFAELHATANMTHVFADAGHHAVRRSGGLDVLNRQMALFLTFAKPYFDEAPAVANFTSGDLEVKSIRDITGFLYSLLRSSDSDVLAGLILEEDSRFEEDVTSIRDAYESGDLASAPTLMDSIDAVSPIIARLLLQLRDRTVADDDLRTALVDGNLTGRG